MVHTVADTLVVPGVEGTDHITSGTDPDVSKLLLDLLPLYDEILTCLHKDGNQSSTKVKHTTQKKYKCRWCDRPPYASTDAVRKHCRKRHPLHLQATELFRTTRRCSAYCVKLPCDVGQ